jgi:thiol:disulfide interchange protein
MISHGILIILLMVSGQGAKGKKGLDLIKGLHSKMKINESVTPKDIISPSALYRINGQTLLINIQVKVKSGWYFYHTNLGSIRAKGKPSKIVFTPKNINWSLPLLDTPKVMVQKGIGISGHDPWVYVHDGTFSVSGITNVNSTSLSVSPKISITGLACKTRGSCVLVKWNGVAKKAEKSFLKFPLISKFKFNKIEDPDSKPQKYNPIGAPKSRSVLIWLFLGFLGGLFLNVMPCVFPILSLKIYTILKLRERGESESLLTTGAYALGIISLFVALGGISMGFNLAWGEQFQSPIFTMVVISMLFLFALSLLGVYEISIPLINNVNLGKSSNAFMLGVFTTILATPCTGPYMGTALAWSMGKSTPVVLGLFGSMGVGMAFPYIIMGLFPAITKWIPKPGAWMERIKQISGFFLLATIIWLMFSLRRDYIVPLNGLLLFLAMGIWIHGEFISKMKGFRKWIGVVLVIGAILGGTRMSFKLLGPSISNRDLKFWQPYTEELFENSKTKNRSIILDFTADWCPNCKWNEKWVLNSKEIKEEIKKRGVIPIYGDMTHNNKKALLLKKLRTKLGGHSLPFLAIFPKGSHHKPYVFYGILSKKEIMNSLKTIPIH